MKKWLTLLLALAVCGSACAETLEVSARGDEVLAAQQRLAELGYLSGGADGIFGAQTAGAVELFQEKNGLTPTGEIDEATREMLDSDGAIALLPTLKKGSRGDAVAAVQAKLIALGYLSGEADGIYGADTAAGVQAFQRHLIAQGVDVTADGAADWLTQEVLLDENYSTFVRILQMGDADAEVARLEQKLIDLGYLDGRADEKYDDYTAAVVAAFQTDSGLTVTGAADKDTVDAMFGENPATAAASVPHDVAQGDFNDAVRGVQAVLIRHGLLGGVTDGIYSETVEAALERYHEYLLREGSELAPLLEKRGAVTVTAQEAMAGEALVFVDPWDEADKAVVTRVQNRLHTLYYMHQRDIDGYFGEVTREALEAFQEKNGLEITGVADDATQRALFSADAAANVTPHLIEVSIADQEVYVYALNADGEYELDRTFICSTGVLDSTPRGIFMDTLRVRYWHYFVNFDHWAQYTYQITGPIMFHSILYLEQDEETLCYDTLEALGTPASHGCVRLRPEDAGWIFENCAHGTIVKIY